VACNDEVYVVLMKIIIP